MILITSLMSMLALSALNLAWRKVVLFSSPKKSLSSMPSASYRNISLSYWIRTKSSRICMPPIVVCDSTKPHSDVL